MKIDPTIHRFTLQKPPAKNVFDLDVKLSKQATDDKITNHLAGTTVTSISKAPCPSANSFCC